MKNLRERYTDKLLHRLEGIKKRMPLIRKAGAMLVEAKASGGRLLVYDRTVAMSLDCWTRGSGLYDIHIYRYSRKEFRDGDALILGSYAADDPDDLLVARELRAFRKTRLVTICPHRRSGEPRSETLLHTLADVAVDNGCGGDAGMFEAKGVSHPVLPIAREVNFTINWAIQCEYIQGMVDRGFPPTLFYLVHFPFFQEMDAVMKKRMERYGY